MINQLNQKIVHRFFSRKKEEEKERKNKKRKRIVQIDLITSQTRMQITDSTIDGRVTSYYWPVSSESHAWQGRGAHTRGQGLGWTMEGGGIDIELSATWRQPVTRADVTRLRGPKGRREDDGKVDCPWFTHWWLAQLSCQRATPAAPLIHSSRPFHVKLRDSINGAPLVNAFVTASLAHFRPPAHLFLVKLSRRANYPLIVTILFIFVHIYKM